MTVAARKIQGAMASAPDAAGGGILPPSPVATFTMPTPPSTNELYKNVKGRGRVKAGVYDNFIMMAIAAIRRQKIARIPGYVSAVFGVERMSLQADIDNRLKAMLDAIVKAEIIDDDRFVTSIAVSWLPKANGMAHIRLMPVGNHTLEFHASSDGASGAWIFQAPQPNGDEDGDCAF